MRRRAGARGRRRAGAQARRGAGVQARRHGGAGAGAAGARSASHVDAPCEAPASFPLAKMGSPSVTVPHRSCMRAALHFASSRPQYQLDTVFSAPRRELQRPTLDVFWPPTFLLHLDSQRIVLI